MPEPKNKKLYEKVKDEIYKEYPKHSAYRSSLLVKTYKAKGGEYIGKKNSEKGLGNGIERGGLIHEEKLDINIKMIFTDLL